MLPCAHKNSSTNPRTGVRELPQLCKSRGCDGSKKMCDHYIPLVDEQTGAEYVLYSQIFERYKKLQPPSTINRICAEFARLGILPLAEKELAELCTKKPLDKCARP